MATLDRLGRGAGGWRTMLRTDSQLITRSPILGQGSKYGGKRVNARHLDDFDALLLLPSGAGTLSPQQRQDLLDFVRLDGKGLILGHAALFGFYDWEPFGDLIGGRPGGEFFATATAQVEDPDFPGAMGFGAWRFDLYEQHAVLKAPWSREDSHVIVSLDPASLSPEQRQRRPDGDFPVAWVRQEGAGRIYHMTWGHLEQTWDHPGFQAMLTGGIQWAMGAA